MNVTLAVCELSQKLCRNVNISASAVPKGFLARVKIPIISVDPPLREMFFSVAKVLTHTSNKMKQVKTFVQCSLLEKFPWNANVVGMSHVHWPHANFTRFQKNNLGYFWPRLPMVKVFVFSWSFLAKDTYSESFVFSWSFLAKVTSGESICFSLTFLAKVTFIGHFGYEYHW